MQICSYILKILKPVNAIITTSSLNNITVLLKVLVDE